MDVKIAKRVMALQRQLKAARSMANRGELTPVS